MVLYLQEIPRLGSSSFWTMGSRDRWSWSPSRSPAQMLYTLGSPLRFLSGVPQNTQKLNKVDNQTGCFCKWRVLLVGIVITRPMLFGVYVFAPNVWKLPNLGSKAWQTPAKYETQPTQEDSRRYTDINEVHKFVT